MLTYLVKAVLQCIHLLEQGTAIVVTTSCHIGRAIFLVLLKICQILGDIFSAVVIFGEELYQFLGELHASVQAVTHYVETSTNGGINCVIEAVMVFCLNMGNFFTNTKLHSNLLATKLGYFVCYVIELTKNALLLIADCAWWTVTLIPRHLIYWTIELGDFGINCITAVLKLVAYTITVIVEDIFRVAIALAVLVLLWHNRRRLALKFGLCCWLLKRALLYCCRKVFASKARFSPVVRTSPPSSPELQHSAYPQQTCVVCRDRHKCILLLPCKHLCLCKECKAYMISSAQGLKCPLCRKTANNSMLVYT